MLQAVVIGAGGLGREIMEFIDACQAQGQPIEGIGFVDDNASRWGEIVNDRPILGSLDWFDEKPGRRDIRVICGISDPYIRRREVLAAQKLGLQFCNVIHPTASISRYAKVGIGVALGQCSVIECQARVGNHVAINMFVAVGHDSVVGDYCFIGPGAVITGGVHLGEGVFVGLNATSRYGVHVGDGVTIGAMTMLLEDVPADATVVGVPGRVVKIRQPGWAAGVA